MLTRCIVRFVDRDMFMRYRGGGIGHTYMREIEEAYENMSRERIHHQEHKRATSPNPDSTNNSSDDEHEPSASTGAQATREGNSGSESDSDYEPSDSGDSDSSEESHTDDLDSEGELFESYGLGDL